MSDPPDVPEPGADRATFDAWREAALQRRAADIERTARIIRGIWWGGLWRIMAAEWTAIGLVLWSVHTTSITAGTIAFYGGLGLGYGGFLALLAVTMRKVDEVKPW